MNNPEFLRNLWLQMSLHRVIAMPLILGLVLLTVYAAGGGPVALYRVATGLFVALVLLWGTRNAAASITDEMRERTWDQQRMSAMSPWSMTWGKLLGATAFNWYGGILCLALMAVLTLLLPDTLPPLLLPTLIAAAILLHAAALTATLHLGRTDARLVRRGSSMAGLVVIVAIAVMAFDGDAGGTVVWWGVPLPLEVFLLGSAVLFAAVAVCGAARVMANALQVKTLPWAWPAFALLVTLYLAGFPMRRAAASTGVLATGLLVAAALTYAALFSESAGVTVWRRVAARLRARRWRDAFEHLPLWPTTLALAFVFALLLAARMGDGDVGQTERFSPFNRDSYVDFPLVIVLMVLRDACVYQFFAFGARAHRVGGTTLVYLVVIDLVLPFFAGAIGWHALASVLLPIGVPFGGNPWSNVAIMAAHAGIAFALVRWRWRQHAARHAASRAAPLT